MRLLASLAFVSPQLVSEIVNGTVLLDLNVTRLAGALPHFWRQQHRFEAGNYLRPSVANSRSAGTSNTIKCFTMSFRLKDEQLLQINKRAAHEPLPSPLSHLEKLAAETLRRERHRWHVSWASRSEGGTVCCNE